MYASVAILTGYTFEYIGEYMTIPRLKALGKANGGEKSTPRTGNVIPLDNAALVRDLPDPRKLRWHNG
jgi:hypothetical protein